MASRCAPGLCNIHTFTSGSCTMVGDHSQGLGQEPTPGEETLACTAQQSLRALHSAAGPLPTGFLALPLLPCRMSSGGGQDSPRAVERVHGHYEVAGQVDEEREKAQVYGEGPARGRRPPGAARMPGCCTARPGQCRAAARLQCPPRLTQPLPSPAQCRPAPSRTACPPPGTQTLSSPPSCSR